MSIVNQGESLPPTEQHNKSTTYRPVLFHFFSIFSGDNKRKRKEEMYAIVPCFLFVLAALNQDIFCQKGGSARKRSNFQRAQAWVERYKNHTLKGKEKTTLHLTWLLKILNNTSVLLATPQKTHSRKLALDFVSLDRESKRVGCVGFHDGVVPASVVGFYSWDMCLAFPDWSCKLLLFTRDCTYFC